jgi:uncharacterized membrane protein YuzA (DUF378 family)
MDNFPASGNTVRDNKKEVFFMDMIALILSIVGSLNWGLVALFKFDLVAWLFGGQTALLSRIVYALVAVAGVWCATFLFRRDAVTD